MKENIVRKIWKSEVSNTSIVVDITSVYQDTFTLGLKNKHKTHNH